MTGNYSEPLAVPVSKLVGVARLIGIDPINEPQYLWIAEEAAQDKVGPEWKEFVDESGATLYYNSKSKKTQKQHPIIEKYAQIYHKQKAFKVLVATQSAAEADEKQSRLSALIKDILQRANRQMSTCTPDIIERLCALLKVDSSREFYLVRCIKLSLEAYVEKQFDLASFTDDLEEPLNFLRLVRKQQVNVDIIKKPDNVVLCQECEARSAVLKCEQCKDYFCQDCFNATHATGKRRGHVTQDVEQLVCAACDVVLATCQCVQCGLFYCDNCFSSTHAARPELHNHLRRIINGLVCTECEHYNANVLCEDCGDLFCTECFIKLHRRGRRRQHVHLTIDNTGQVFRGGFLVPPEEAQLLIDRARSTVEGGPWLAFKDDLGETFWYHLAKRITSTRNPYEDPEMRAEAEAYVTGQGPENLGDSSLQGQAQLTDGFKGPHDHQEHAPQLGQ